MRTSHCAMGLVLGAALLGACHGDGPTAPRVLRFLPYCPGICFIDGPYANPSPGWVAPVGGVAGAPATLGLVIADQHSVPVPGVLVRWTVIGRGGFVDVPASISDSAGIVKVQWTLDTIAKPDSMVGWLASGESILAVASPSHAAPAIITRLGGDSQIVALGENPKPFVIRLADRYGNPVAGARVAWTVGGLGAVTALTTTTDADGTTTNTIHPPTTAGVYAVIATFGSVPAAVFRVDAK